MYEGGIGLNVKAFHRPRTVDEVVALLAGGGNAKLLAGGTDLVIALRERTVRPDALIDLSCVEGLRDIYEEGETLHIGAGVTFTQLQYSPLAAEYCPALCDAAGQMGAVQVRNLATLGGNVANAATAADGLPALLAMDAVAVIKSPKGGRTLPVAQVVTGINKTCLGPDELICEFQMRARPGAAKVFQKIGRRKALAISRINLAVCAQMDGEKVEIASVAVGAVGKTCYRVTEVEDFLAGKRLDGAVIEAAADLMDEVVARNLAGRSTTPYKRKIARAVLKKSLERIAGGEGV
jgi:CO/xanthine dehydrogenase FAD-binding subunit